MKNKMVGYLLLGLMILGMFFGQKPVTRIKPVEREKVVGASEVGSPNN